LQLPLLLHPEGAPLLPVPHELHPIFIFFVIYEDNYFNLELGIRNQMEEYLNQLMFHKKRLKYRCRKFSTL
jgi:hypothetical protein